VAAGLLAIALIGGLATALVLQLAAGPDGSAGSAGSAGSSVGSGVPGSGQATLSAAVRSSDWTTQPPATGISSPEAGSTPSARTTLSPTPTPKLAPPGPTPGASWQQDSSFIAAKMGGRVARDSNGGVVVLTRAPELTFPQAATLVTSWSGQIQEPPRTGKDDRGVAYTDYNYSGFCGAGAAVVTLYYWPASHGAVTTRSGTFVEPVNLGTNRHATTYWKAEGAGGYARGMILSLAEEEWPTPDHGLPWWPLPGLMNWSASPPSTNVANLTDAVNWEASGGSRLAYFYVAVRAAEMDQTDLRAFVHLDIHYGVPVIVAARTSDGTYALPYWNVKSTSSAVNHFVTIVGYDDTAGTYSVMDTCGTTCNDKNARAGVKTMSQAAVYALIVAESDNDGVIW
jgi:hypothetical protein